MPSGSGSSIRIRTPGEWQSGAAGMGRGIGGRERRDARTGLGQAIGRGRRANRRQGLPRRAPDRSDRHRAARLGAWPAVSHSAGPAAGRASSGRATRGWDTDRRGARRGSPRAMAAPRRPAARDPGAARQTTPSPRHVPESDGEQPARRRRQRGEPRLRVRGERAGRRARRPSVGRSYPTSGR
jgi:hypothetical protein